MSMPTRQAGQRHDCQEAPAVRVEDVPEDVPEVQDKFWSKATMEALVPAFCLKLSTQEPHQEKEEKGKQLDEAPHKPSLPCQHHAGNGTGLLLPGGCCRAVA